MIADVTTSNAKRVRFLALALVATCGISAAGGAIAQEPSAVDPEQEYALARRAYDFARETMSPFCPGRTLADCPSPNAKVLRERVRRMMASGLNEDDIARELQREYGTVVQALPQTSVGWILPGTILGAGVILLGVVLVRLSRPSPSVEGPVARIDRALERELEEALRAEGLDADPGDKPDARQG